jgi:LysM repeat protein
MRLFFGAAPIERVNISRLGRSLSAAVLVSVTASAAAFAQASTRADASTHTVKRGDTLWDLAKSYLGDSYLWPEIYRINTDQIEDPHWIYPGEILKLPGRTAAPAVAAAPVAPAEQPPVRRTSGTVFSPRTLVFGRSVAARERARPHVALADVTRAPFYTQVGGPSHPGKIMYGADIPGIDKAHAMTNFQLYDKLVIEAPFGSAAAQGQRYVAYRLGPTDENVGTVVIPVAILQVIRSQRGEEAAIAEVREVYGEFDADTKLLAVDTTGAGATGLPVALPAGSGQSAKLLEIDAPAVLPSLGHYVLFHLTSNDGLRIGDEIEIYRSRTEPQGDDGLTLPEVSIATGQVVRVTQFGATARVTTQAQPAIRTGEQVRVTARMP